MPIVTTSSLEQRTSPAWAEWAAPDGATKSQQFDDVADAIDFPDKLHNDHHLTVWVRPATGPVYFPEG